jgi:hypothetical protein
MKIIVDLEDFWPEEEEGDLPEQIKKHVIWDVTRQVWNDVRTEVKRELQAQITQTIDSQLKDVIAETISDEVDKGVINNRGLGDPIKITDHVRNLFHNKSGWCDADKKIERIAADFAKELKLQYNNVFAAKIVDNMKKQGLLKDEVTQLLLEGTE